MRCDATHDIFSSALLSRRQEALSVFEVVSHITRQGSEGICAATSIRDLRVYLFDLESTKRQLLQLCLNCQRRENVNSSAHELAVAGSQTCPTWPRAWQ
jgi:hypothetical protein